jgi:sphinganine-1-phosphate aldolase
VKKHFFRLVKTIPAVKRRIGVELEKADRDLEKDVSKMYGGPCIQTLPLKGLSRTEVVEAVGDYMARGPFDWKSGQCSGAVYHGGEELTAVLKEVWGNTMWSNALHMNVFPGKI